MFLALSRLHTAPFLEALGTDQLGVVDCLAELGTFEAPEVDEGVLAELPLNIQQDSFRRLRRRQ